MFKFGAVGIKRLKMLHILLVIFFMGGILSSTALNLYLSFASYEEVYITYRGLVTISDQIVRTGAIGTLLVGVIYGVFTNWGFFKHRWVTVKWLTFILQTLLGIFVIDKLMVANMTLLESEQAAALINPIFIDNHSLRQYVVFSQIVLSIFMIIISVQKPWGRNRKATAAT